MRGGLLDEVFFEIVDEFEVYFDVLVALEGDMVEERVEMFYEIAEHGDFSLLLDETNRVDNEELLECLIRGALVEQRIATSSTTYNRTLLKID